MTRPDNFDPELDLWFERETRHAPALVWRAWTEPEQLMKWFCPRPWRVVECRMDVRVGGGFYTRMEGPDGASMPGAEGCILAVEPERRLAWTDALCADFRPNLEPFQSADVRMAPKPDGGTHYTVHVRHANAEKRKAHEDMGFEHGWGAAWEQLVELVDGDFA